MYKRQPYEKNKIEELINILSESSEPEAINVYSLNRYLGFLFFLKGENEKALNHFNKAVEVFPLDKKDDDFNTLECQNMILTIYKMNSDTLNYKKGILRKIENEPDKSKTLDDIMLLAFYHFSEQRWDQANRLCDEAMVLNANEFDALRMKSQLNFLKGDRQLAQFYVDHAGKHIKNPIDEYNLTIQFATHLIYDGKKDMAKALLESFKAFRGSRGCTECDTLLKEFCR